MSVSLTYTVLFCYTKAFLTYGYFVKTFSAYFVYDVELLLPYKFLFLIPIFSWNLSIMSASFCFLFYSAMSAYLSIRSFIGSFQGSSLFAYSTSFKYSCSGVNSTTIFLGISCFFSTLATGLITFLIYLTYFYLSFSFCANSSFIWASLSYFCLSAS